MIDFKCKFIAFFGASVALLLVVLTPVGAYAQELSLGEKVGNAIAYPFRRVISPSKNACITDKQCVYDNTSCQGGFCVIDPNKQIATSSSSSQQTSGGDVQMSSTTEPGMQGDALQNVTTEEECDMDRRCRINRLKRRNQARRYQTMLEEEQRVMDYQSSVKQKRKDAKPRTAKPLSTEFYVSFGFGFAAAYSLSDHLRLEGTLTYLDSYVDAETVVDGQTVYSSGYVDGWNAGGAVTYLMRSSWWTPYVSGAMILHRGNYSSWGGYDGFGFDFEGSSGVQSIMHLAEARFGFDVQLNFGARARLGVLYRYPIYTQAKTGVASYDDGSREILNEWIKGERRIAPEFSIGWAF